MDNAAIARVLNEIADLLEIKDENPFKIRAYRGAGETVADEPEPVATMTPQSRLALPGIGKDLAAKIGELVETGTIAYHQQLLQEFPPTILDLLRLQGVGPKTVARLFREIGVSTLEALEGAATDGRIRRMKGMGPRKEALILKALDQRRRHSSGGLFTDVSELAATLDGELVGAGPPLVRVTDLRGDVHCHTTTTDGRDTIEAMARAAHAAGLQYLAITDHSKSLAMANGLDEAGALAHARAVREVAARLELATGFVLLAGIECDIRADGSMDLADDCLAQLDIVNASIHSGFSQDGAAHDRPAAARDRVPVGGRHCPSARAPPAEARRAPGRHGGGVRRRGQGRGRDGNQRPDRAARSRRGARAAGARRRRPHHDQLRRAQRARAWAACAGGWLSPAGRG